VHLILFYIQQIFLLSLQQFYQYFLFVIKSAERFFAPNHFFLRFKNCLDVGYDLDCSRAEESKNGIDHRSIFFG